MAEKTANEIMDEVVKHPTLDLYLDRNPSTLKWPKDYMAMIEMERKARATFFIKEQEKKAKKQGIEPDKEEN